MQVSKILIFVLFIVGMGFLYLSWTYDSEYSKFIIPVGILFAASLVFAPQIDWWWMKRNPTKVDPEIIAWLDKHLPGFSDCSPEIRAKFLHRTELMRSSWSFMPQGFEDIPTDVAYIIAAYSALLTFHKDKFLFENYENIILYKHPFPSPQFPNQFHHSEIFYEDEVMLFDMDQLYKSFILPQEIFPIGLYEIANAYIKVFGFTAPRKLNEELFLAITGKELDWVYTSVGLDKIQLDAVLIALSIYYPKEYAVHIGMSVFGFQD